MPTLAMALPPDLTTLVDAQSGMVARWQTREHGVPDHVLRALLRGGGWQVRSPGVYAAFSGPPTRQSDLWAAILHCSRRPGPATPPTHAPDAVLSHATAAELYGFADRSDPLIHVTIPSGRGRPKSHPGVRIHVSARLQRSRHPVLWPPRTRLDDTVLDLAQTAGDLDAAIEWLSRACGHRLTTPARLAEAVGARDRMRWRAELRYALRDDKGPHTLLEVRYQREVERAHGLPAGTSRPGRLNGQAVRCDDVAYEEYATVVHLDGRVHETRPREPDPGELPEAGEATAGETPLRDGRRDVTGGEVPLRHDRRDVTVVGGSLRYGWHDVTTRPCAVAAQVAHALTTNGWPGSPRACDRPSCPIR
jgi:hypothetical protein